MIAINLCDAAEETGERIGLGLHSVVVSGMSEVIAPVMSL